MATKKAAPAAEIVEVVEVHPVIMDPLRDDFAKAAVNGLCAGSHTLGIQDRNPATLASRAYAIADAMLKERVKT